MNAQELLAVGTEMASARGYQLRRPDGRTAPPAVATAGGDVEAVHSGRTDTLTEFALEPVIDPDPTTVLSRHWSNRAAERETVFVAPDGSDAEDVADVLRPPVGVPRERTDGCRTFFNGPDRVPVDDGGYAALEKSTEVVWREIPGEKAQGRAGTDRKRLELVADSVPRAELAGIGALECPPASAFPYRYQRLGDKRFHVFDATGRELGVFSSVAAVKTRFTPVPMPLVPDHLFDGSIAGTWAVIDAAEAEWL